MTRQGLPCLWDLCLQFWMGKLPVPLFAWKLEIGGGSVSYLSELRVRYPRSVDHLAPLVQLPDIAYEMPPVDSVNQLDHPDALRDSIIMYAASTVSGSLCCALLVLPVFRLTFGQFSVSTDELTGKAVKLGLSEHQTTLLLWLHFAACKVPANANAPLRDFEVRADRCSSKITINEEYYRCLGRVFPPVIGKNAASSLLKVFSQLGNIGLDYSSL